MIKPAIFCLALLHLVQGARSEDIPLFSTAIGTQTIGVKYQFTDEGALLETAKEIQRMGGDTLKISVGPKYRENYRLEQDPEIKSILDLVQTKPDFSKVFDMPFRNIMLWVYPFSDKMSAFYRGEIPKAEADAMYQEIYDFTAHLLRTYSGTGKTFFLGNWEGDWHVLKHQYNYDLDPAPESIQGAIQWFNLRQKAVADAIAATSHHGVKVYFYIELNHVRKSMESGRPTIVNSVLPHTKTDFVSWSSYDVTSRASIRGGKEGRKQVFEALDFIEKHLPPSDIKGKRVFIGEYGLNREQAKSAEDQAEFTRRVMLWSLEWGCPFVLFWELYCNEINETTGAHRGFWLIDDKGKEQPTWDLHRNFLIKANRFVEEYVAKNGRLPAQADYNKAAVSWLKSTKK
jgi:hypothetical protein